jgi:hypothetical protein
MISRKESRSHHDMMLGTMHMAELHVHHLTYDLYRVARGLIQAKSYDGVHSLGMAFITDIMTINASGLTELTLVTYAAFHQDILLKVVQRSLAYQAFFLHIR